jgi:hypothetical protein
MSEQQIGYILGYALIGTLGLATIGSFYRAWEEFEKLKFVQKLEQWMRRKDV